MSPYVRGKLILNYRCPTCHTENSFRLNSNKRLLCADNEYLDTCRGCGRSHYVYYNEKELIL